MTTKSLVSVIMPCYKMGRFIGEALASVGSQTYTNWEVLAVDDCGPEDGTREAVEAFAAKFPGRRIEYIRHEKNGGVSAARNTAIAAAKGEFLAFLDPDDLWLPHYLKNSVDAFAADKEIAAVACPVDEYRMDDPHRRPVVWKIADWRGRHFPASLATNCFIQLSATIVRRDAVLAIGGFDTSPALQHIEDYDLWIRLAQDGCRFHFLKEPGCRYRRHETQATSEDSLMLQRHYVLHQKHQLFFSVMQGLLIASSYKEMELNKNTLRHPFRWLTKKLVYRLRLLLSR